MMLAFIERTDKTSLLPRRTWDNKGFFTKPSCGDTAVKLNTRRTPFMLETVHQRLEGNIIIDFGCYF